MGFEAMFPQRRLRHEAGESGNAQEKPEITSIDLDGGTVTLRRAPEPDAPDRPGPERGA